jgi:hypothetical protein
VPDPKRILSIPGLDPEVRDLLFSLATCACEAIGNTARIAALEALVAALETTVTGLVTNVDAIETTLAGGSLTGLPTFVYRPGGAETAFIKATMAGTAAAARAYTAGPKNIGFDDSLAPLVVPAGVYDFGDQIAEFMGLHQGAFGLPELLVQDGASLAEQSIPLRWTDLWVICMTSAGASFINTSSNATFQTSFLRSFIFMSSSGAFWKATSPSFNILYFEFGGIVASFPGAGPGFVTDDGSNTSIILATDSQVDPNMIESAVNPVFTVALDPASFVNSTQFGAGIDEEGNYFTGVRFGATSVDPGVSYLGDTDDVANLNELATQLLISRGQLAHVFGVMQSTAGAGAGNLVYSFRQNGVTVASISVAAGDTTFHELALSDAQGRLSDGTLVSIQCDASGVVGGLPTDVKATVE